MLLPIEILLLTSVLSAISTFFVMLIYLKSSEVRRDFAYKLIFFISTSDFFWSLSFIVFISKQYMNDGTTTELQYENVCNIFAAIQLAAGQSLFIWTSIISFVLFKGIVLKSPVSEKSVLNAGYLVNLALQITSISVIQYYGNFGPADPDKQIFCFIHLNLTPAYDSADIQMTMFFYAPFVCCLFLNFYVMFQVICSKTSGPKQLVVERKMRTLIIVYPLTLLLVWGWYGFAQFYGVIYNRENWKWINQVVMIVSSLSGLINTIVFSVFALQQNILQEIFCKEVFVKERLDSKNSELEFDREFDVDRNRTLSSIHSIN